MRTFHRSYKLIQISRFLKRDRVVDLKGATKDEVLSELVGVISKSSGGAIGSMIGSDALLKAIWDREAKFSTGVGVGIAIPHARLAVLKEFVIAIGRCKMGVSYDALDAASVYLIFMILSPAQEYAQYLNVHAKVALLMSNEEFRNKLLAAKDSDEMYRLLKGK